MSDVTVLGVGRMGSAMVRRLADAGHSVAVWNRTASAAGALAEEIGSAIRVADSPQSAVRGSQLVISMLATGPATCSVLLNDEVLGAFAPQTIVCDMATSGMEAAQLLASGLSKAGIRYLDAPVSGSVASVLSGALLVMASGEAAAVAEATPMLSAFARKVLHVGPPGAGQAMKLAVNLVVHGLNSSLSESLVLAEGAGISRNRAYDVLVESVISGPFVQYKRPAFTDADTPVAMSLDLVSKDLALIEELASEVGLTLGATVAVHEQVDAARSAGYGSLDMAALSFFLGAQRS